MPWTDQPGGRHRTIVAVATTTVTVILGIASLGANPLSPAAWTTIEPCRGVDDIRAHGPSIWFTAGRDIAITLINPQAGPDATVLPGLSPQEKPSSPKPTSQPTNKPVQTCQF